MKHLTLLSSNPSDKSAEMHLYGKRGLQLILLIPWWILSVSLSQRSSNHQYAHRLQCTPLLVLSTWFFSIYRWRAWAVEWALRFVSVLCQWHATGCQLPTWKYLCYTSTIGQKLFFDVLHVIYFQTLTNLVPYSLNLALASKYSDTGIDLTLLYSFLLYEAHTA